MKMSKTIVLLVISSAVAGCVLWAVSTSFVNQNSATDDDDDDDSNESKGQENCT